MTTRKKCQIQTAFHQRWLCMPSHMDCIPSGTSCFICSCPAFLLRHWNYLLFKYHQFIFFYFPCVLPSPHNSPGCIVYAMDKSLPADYPTVAHALPFSNVTECCPTLSLFDIWPAKRWAIVGAARDRDGSHHSNIENEKYHVPPNVEAGFRLSRVWMNSIPLNIAVSHLNYRPLSGDHHPLPPDKSGKSSQLARGD
uniref:ARAD1A15268p n=1 Tax=Blastobotrys adeninivorans TaxID=409370 RepID=A0A060SYY7_BLAAD